MKSSKTGWLLLAVVLLALWPGFRIIQEARWKKANDAGMKALQEGRYAEAEQHLTAARKQAEKFGKQDARLATSLNNLAELYQTQGKYAEAEPLYKRALAILTKAMGPDHPNVAMFLGNYAVLLRKMDREAEAAKMETRAQAIRAKHAQKNPPK